MNVEPRLSPMFPLGSVLLPQGSLPLHIFEPRYQQLLNVALEGDRTFGVVMITRGSEVGGGEQRSAVGTLARIDEHRRFDDGRAAVIATGVSRIEVVEWLPDDPFPRANIVDLIDDAASDSDSSAVDDVRDAFVAMLATALAIGRLDQLPTVDWATDPQERFWQLANLVPMGELDRQALLTETAPSGRTSHLATVIEDTHTDLRLLAEFD